MDRTPLVSVLMPVYNARSHLQEAIDSILIQTFADLELLIIDDGSTDGSLQLAQSYSDSRVRVLEASHQGIVVALNRGLAEARGQYVARMDADDISTCTRLEKQVEYMMSHDSIVMIGSWVRLINADGKAIGICLTQPISGRALHVSLCASNQFVHGSIMMRAEAARTVGGYRLEFATAEDYDLWLRLSEIGELANIPSVLYHLRIHQSSKTVSEGSLIVKRYTDQARQCSLQRYLRGRDFLGHATPQVAKVVDETQTPSQSRARIVTLSDWGQVLLWQGQMESAIRILWHATVVRPHKVRLWPLVLPSFANKAYFREVLRAVNNGSWIALGWSKVRRILNRVEAGLNAS